MLEVRRFGG